MSMHRSKDSRAILAGVIVARNADGTYQVRRSDLPDDAAPWGRVPGPALSARFSAGERVSIGLMGDPPDVQRPLILDSRSRIRYVRYVSTSLPWPQSGHDSAHSYNNPDATASWSLALDGAWTAIPHLATGPVATGDSLLYQTHSSDPSGQRLVLTSLATGVATWALSWTGPCHPAIHGDSVYCYDGSTLKRLSLADGSTSWTATSPRYAGPPMFDDARGSVHILSTIGPTFYVTALSQADGTVKWTRTLPSGGFNSRWVVFASDLIQVGYYTYGTVPARLLALSPVDGSTAWDQRLDSETDPDWGSQVTGQVVSVGGVTCVPITVLLNKAPFTTRFQVIAVSASGSISWRVDVPFMSGVEATIGGAGSDWILVTSPWDDSIRALSTSGSPLWTLPSAGLFEGGPATTSVACALAGDTALIVSSYPTGSGQRVRAMTVNKAGSNSSWSTLSTASPSSDAPSEDTRNEERLILVGGHAYHWDPARNLVRIA